MAPFVFYASPTAAGYSRRLAVRRTIGLASIPVLGLRSRLRHRKSLRLELLLLTELKTGRRHLDGVELRMCCEGGGANIATASARPHPQPGGFAFCCVDTVLSMPFAVLIGPEAHNKVAGPRNQCAAGYFKSAATDF